jgi:hypothetical protein
VVTPYQKVGSTDKFSSLSINSTGSYKHAFGVDAVKRAIHLDSLKDESQDAAPEISGSVSKVVFPTGEELVISANIFTNGHGVKEGSAMAHIIGYSNGRPVGGADWPNLKLLPSNGTYSDGIYTYTFKTINIALAYTVEVMACDAVNDVCTPYIPIVNKSEPMQ